MSSWHSYPKVYNLGHRTIAALLSGLITIEEKIDGSQFSFGKFDGVIRCRSHHKELDLNAPCDMFGLAVESVLARADKLRDGWTYRGEFLQRPKHNALAYNRTPNGFIILYDVNYGEEAYLNYHDKVEEAERIGLECVPRLVCVDDLMGNEDFLKACLEITSILGGQKIEGVVIKNYNRFTTDGHAMMGKYVSPAFKEIHRHSWNESNPKQGDILERVIETLKTEARWNKAIIHLRERGELSDDPRDIGPLIREVIGDTIGECHDDIAAMLVSWATPHIKRGVVRGFPEWYKERLMKSQFESN